MKIPFKNEFDAIIKNGKATTPKEKLILAGVATVACLIVMLNVTASLILYFAAIYLLWSRLSPRLSEILESHQWKIAIGLPLLMFAGFLVAREPMALDDLLRNILVGNHYSFHYRLMYPLADVPAFDQYWGFDHVLAVIEAALSPIIVMHLVQAFVFCSMAAIVTLVAKQLTEGKDNAAYWACIVLTAALSMSSFRMILGRPEIIFSVWAIASILVSNCRRLVVWTLVGCAFSTGYWLAFIYFIAVVATNVRIKDKILSLLALGMFHALFWLGMFGMEYVDSLLWLPQVLKQQILPVGENEGVEHAFSVVSSPYSFLFIAALGLATIGCITRPSRQTLYIAVLALFFIASNQVRYIGIIGPLLALLALSAWKNDLPPLNSMLKMTIVFICSTILITTAYIMPSVKNTPDFKIPANSLVIGDMSASYMIMFFNPGIQTGMSFAYGAQSKEIQKLAADINSGDADKLDCNLLRSQHFTHVVEKTFSAKPVECLKFEEAKNSWRLWKVTQ